MRSVFMVIFRRRVVQKEEEPQPSRPTYRYAFLNPPPPQPVLLPPAPPLVLPPVVPPVPVRNSSWVWVRVWLGGKPERRFAALEAWIIRLPLFWKLAMVLPGALGGYIVARETGWVVRHSVFWGGMIGLVSPLIVLGLLRVLVPLLIAGAVAGGLYWAYGDWLRSLIP